MKTKTIIGIPLDYEQSGSFSKRPYYALRHHYFDAITACGALPVALPLDVQSIPDHLALCHGILLPGGTYAFDEDWYLNPSQNTPKLPPNPRRTYDQTLTKALYEQKIPTLGICAGMQVMAGVLGGKFYKDVSKELPTPFDHLNATEAENEAHAVQIPRDSTLYKTLNRPEMQVNTAHREALAACPDGTELCATSPDGVIEAIAWRDHPFGIGVQWHPEFFLDNNASNPHLMLLRGLIQAAESYKHA